MPASQSKFSFDAVKTDNIYLTDSKIDRNGKRKNSFTDEITHQKKKVVSDSMDVKTVNAKPSTKHQKSKFNSNERKLSNTSSDVSAAKKLRKRQMEIGNAYSKLNSKVKNLTKPTEVRPKTILGESSRSSFYLTPRQVDIPISDIDCENINPNRLPETVYESEFDEFIRSQYHDIDDSSSEYDFQEPLVFDNFDLPQDTLQPKNNSLRHFKQLLDEEESAKNKLLQKSEMELLKEIVKSDEQYQNLKNDDYQLLKEILLGQLKEISQQERIIKIALEKIRSRRHQKVELDTFKFAKAEQPLENNNKGTNSENLFVTTHDLVKTKTGKTNAVSGQEVDVFFKNVPSLENEIRILKLLGLKLEETLMKSNFKETTKPPLIMFTIQCVSFKYSISMASSRVLPFSCKYVIGLAKEFRISHQTINELKLERDFYIATDLNNFTVQRTNFDVLRHNPELLLRRLKPITKDSKLKFNFIEQDPLFFNHFLENICKISSTSFPTHGTFIPNSHSFIVSNQKPKMIPVMTMCGAGDHCDVMFKEEIKQKQEVPIMTEKSSKTSIGRKKNKHCRTPMQEQKFVSAKNSILKTILLGSLHLTMVLMVLTAIFYPDIVCF